MNRKTVGSNRRLGIISTLTAIGLVMGMMSAAHAGFKLKIDDGTNVVDCADNGACVDTAGSSGIFGDLTGATDALGASGTIGSWIFTATTALTSHSGIPELMWLNNATISGGSISSPLEISLTNTGFTAGGAGIFLNALTDGGTVAAGGTLEYDLWVHDSDTEFGLGQLIGTSGLLTGSLGTNDSVFSGLASVTGTYSITQVFKIDHSGTSGFNATSFTGKVQAPEPAILGLLAAGLLIGSVTGRRNRRS